MLLTPLSIDGTDWQIIHQSYNQGYYDDDNLYSYQSIPEVIIEPVYSHCIAIKVESQNVRPSWNLAGYVEQKVKTGLGSGIAADSVISTSKIFLRNINILLLPKISHSYTLAIRFPRWFFDASVFVWSRESEDINGKELLQRIEQKIDDISEYGNV